ncbi:myelin protein zero-like protein 1 isoform X2 [Sturnira hondurensis]|uniref:myelin protein zero-like protein 1 isoform X2 n=1 Tax=Sturnira hondurensis TaxID=192404 RepID=UPI001879FD53|nr:myelin protein zero-like protein 1 isoform X2 [Sturnira hondurensis]
MSGSLGGAWPRAGGSGGAASGGAARRCHWVRRRLLLRGGVPVRSRANRSGAGARCAAVGLQRKTMAAPAGARTVIAAPDRRRCLWSVLAAAFGFLTAGVSALEVYTPKEMYVANGTQGKLTCTFKSANTTSMLTTVSWSFQPEGTDTSMSFFHYSQGQEYPGNYPPFKDRISWAGDLDKKDASISIENMQFIHNGTYICDVKNPPDIVAQPGHIRLYVVEKAVLPVFPVWVVVGIVTAVVVGLSLLTSVVLAVLYRRKSSKRDYTGAPSFTRS